MNKDYISSSITSVKLKGSSNYLQWPIASQVSMKVEGKLSFLKSSCPTDEKFASVWGQDDAQVMTAMEHS